MEMPVEWFTVEEAVQYLRVSKRTIYKWSRDGRLPAYLIGNRRHCRYRKDVSTRCLVQQTPKAVSMNSIQELNAIEAEKIIESFRQGTVPNFYVRPAK